MQAQPRSPGADSAGSDDTARRHRVITVSPADPVSNSAPLPGRSLKRPRLWHWHAPQPPCSSNCGSSFSARYGVLYVCVLFVLLYLGTVALLFPRVSLSAGAAPAATQPVATRLSEPR